MVSSVKRQPITSAAKRAAVHRVAASHSKRIRITEGLRKAIVGSSDYRAGRAPSST
jgi:hypothetical protein